MRPLPPNRARWLFALVVASATVHAATVALVRPMFQVSDEIGYFAPAQEFAHQHASNAPWLQERILPGGKPFYVSPTPKRAFASTAGSILAVTARSHASPDAALLTRLAIATCHVAFVAATWCLARRFYAISLEVAFVASLFAAWQPVLTSVNAAITPDAFANALSAWALYFVASCLADDGSWGALLMAALLAIAAFAFKDTAICVFAAVAVAAAVSAWRLRNARFGGRVAALTILGGTALAAWAIPSRHIDDALRQTGALQLDALMVVRLGQLVIDNAVPGFVSFWTTFGNFGGHDIFVSSTWTGSIGVACAGALVGFLLRGSAEPARSAAAWWALGIAFAVSVTLHPLRSLVMQGVDLFQGRYLFPMAAPIMVLLAEGLRRLLFRPRATVAVGATIAIAIGIVPLVVVVVPFFYVEFPAAYNPLNLYLQGTYGRGADPQGAMAFVSPVSATLVGARAWMLAATVGAALTGVIAGCCYRDRAATEGLESA